MPPRAQVAVELNLKGQQRAKAQVKSFGSKVNQVFAKTIKPLLGLALGGAGIYGFVNATKKAMDFDVALTRLAIQGGKTATEQQKVRDAILDVAKATGMSKEEILAAGKSIIDATGDFDFMAGTLENLSSLSQTTGTDMSALGKIAGSLSTQFDKDAEAANRLMRILVEQGEKGSWTLEQMALTAPKVFSALQLAGVNTEKEITDATAYMQVFRVGFATAEEAATAYKGTVARIAMEQDKIKGMGVALEIDGKALSTAEILVDIIDKLEGTDVEKRGQLVKLFGTENIALVTAMQKTYEDAKNEGKDLNEEMKKYTDVLGDAADQQAKLDRILKTSGGGMMTFKQGMDHLFMTTIGTTENLEALGAGARATAVTLATVTKMIQTGAEGQAETMLLFKELIFDLQESIERIINIVSGKLFEAGWGEGDFKPLDIDLVKSPTARAGGEDFQAMSSDDKTEFIMRALGIEGLMEQGGLINEAVTGEPGAAEVAPIPGAGEVKLDADSVRKMEQGVKQGVKEGFKVANIEVFIPSPIADSSKGTQGKPVHEPA